MKRSAWVAVGLGLMITGLALMTGGVLSLALAPHWYEATTRVTVETASTTVTNSATNSIARFAGPHWVQTEFERLQSKLVLFPVITNLNLNQTWAEQLGRTEPLDTSEAYRRLKERLEVRQTRGTSLIEVSVRSPDPSEATRIANAIPDSYHASILNGGILEVVDTATVPTQPMRQKQPTAILLFLTGVLLMLAGYLIVRPHLREKQPPPSI